MWPITAQQVPESHGETSNVKLNVKHVIHAEAAISLRSENYGANILCN